MCVVIDTCSISKVINRKAQDHSRFKPLLAWLEGKHGRIIIGGTKYLKEMKGMSGALRFLEDYKRQGKLIRLNDADVDSYALKAKARVSSSHFNDEHLVGIVTVSRCRVICTDDKEAVPFLTRKELYDKPVRPPKIYSAKSHSHLCGAKNVAPICQYHIK